VFAGPGRDIHSRAFHVLIANIADEIDPADHGPSVCIVVGGISGKFLALTVVIARAACWVRGDFCERRPVIAHVFGERIGERLDRCGEPIEKPRRGCGLRVEDASPLV
jgi:hypothetical protein